MPLTDSTVRSARPKARAYRLGDGDGLGLIVPVTGAKWWRFDYRYAGRRRTISLGVYPDVTLAAVRAKRLQARQTLAAGHDPARERQKQRKATAHAHANTFEAVALEWLEKHADRLAPNTTIKNRSVLTLHVFPVIGPEPISTIEPPDLLVALQKVERRKQHDTAHRAKQLAGQIFRYAIATGRAARDPSADLRGALTPNQPDHYPAFTEPAQIAGLLRAVEAFDGLPQLKAALQFAALTFVRPDNIRRAEWAEIDWESKMWRIPEAKMKMRDGHLVPLATQTIALLKALHAVTGDGRYLFPHPRTRQRPISENALNASLRRLGIGQNEMVAHGYRAMARTYLDERMGMDRDVIEIQLAHRVPGALGATYNRSMHLVKRIAMMAAWADELDRLRLDARGMVTAFQRG